MKKLVTFAASIALASAQTVELRSSAAKIGIDLNGGAIVAFQLTGLAVNPLTWNEGGQKGQLRGHFLCLDRWGAPSEAEKANGVPFHGEAPRVQWTSDSASATEARMHARLPLAGLRVSRVAELRGAVAKITETVTNENKLGRVFNWVQHPSIAPPFLDATTIVDANARQGFMQSSPMPNPENPSVVWPQALNDGVAVNMRMLTNDPNPNVVSYVVDEEWGWTTAATPGSGLLIGYLWKSSEYPWFNAWRHTEKGRPAARGLEFGTTGLHQPYPALVKKRQIFGRPLYDFLDAGESSTKTFWMFLARVPAGYTGASAVRQSGADIVIAGRDGKQIVVPGR
jgi:hypothetical protein